MKAATLLGLTAVLAVCFSVMAPAAEAATIWKGPKFIFKKFRIYNPLDPAYQDRLTPKVWLTRGTNQSLYNIRQEGGFNRPVSPADTEWAWGTTADLPNLTFTPWAVRNNQCSPCHVGRDGVIHLISEDIYIDIKILSWEPTSGNTIYERSTPSGGVSPLI